MRTANKVDVLHVQLTELHAAHQNLLPAIRTLRVKETENERYLTIVVRTYNVHIICHRAKFHKNCLNRSRGMVIYIFFKMAATAILDFQNFNFSTVRTAKRVELHNYAKFCRNDFHHGRDIMIFLYFKMAAAAILDFRNLKFLTGRTVKSVELHHRAKFRQNSSNRGWDIAIIRFFKIADWILKISNFDRSNGQEGGTASVCQISSKSFKPRPRYASFNIMLVWLENAYSRPFWFFGGHIPPKWCHLLS